MSTRKAIVWLEGNKIVALGYDLEAPSEAHVAIDVPEEIEDWRFSVNEQGEIVIAYEGMDREEALAALLADQQAELEARELEVQASR